MGPSGVSSQEAGALEIQAYVGMPKALTVFTVKSKRRGESGRLVVFYSLGPPRDVRTHYA